MKKARDLLSYHAFSTDPGKGVSQDYNKPLIIPAWSDSFEAISGGSSGGSGGGRQNLEMWKHQFTTHFPQSVKNLCKPLTGMAYGKFLIYFWFRRE